MGAVLTRATRRGTLAQIRHVTPTHPRDAEGLVAAVYRQVSRDFGILAPPIALHSPAPTTLAAAWLMLRETLIATGTTDRVTREAVAAAVSAANDCPYCVDVHGAMLQGLAGRGTARGVLSGRPGEVADPALRAVVTWAGGGDQRTPDRPEAACAELIGVAVAFHYLNRMVNVFLDPSPVPSGVAPRVRDVMFGMAGRLLAPTARRARPRGAALALLPAAEPGEATAWAAADPTLRDGFARAYAAVEAAGERSVPSGVRDLVRARLRVWDGKPPGISRAWVEEPLAEIAPPDRAAARLALLTAVASYQVTTADIAAVRRGRTPASLVELTSWASLTAATTIGTRLHAPDAAHRRPWATEH
ncbi:carboxymuconolactone decarboxylase family protein [Micromonospora sp. NPDC051543]|uniref:carboxymuconolactone decarboxylase family protein n=1 Tax=Micromonospora sp. NPDC051543 TaxID=3364287 RepID=UPI00378E9E1F